MPQENDAYPWWLRAIVLALSPLRAPGYTIKRDHTSKFDALNAVAYTDLRERIHNGDLMFCGGNYPFSKTIRYLSGRSKVSHVGIVYWWNERLMLMESVELRGVRIVPVSHYVRNFENTGKPYDGRLYLARDRRLFLPMGSDTAAAAPVPIAKVDQLLGEAATLLNKKFSFKDALVFFWQGCTGRAHYEENEELLCSEFVARCYASVEIPYPGDSRGFVAPEHIAMSDDVDVLVEILREPV